MSKENIGILLANYTFQFSQHLEHCQICRDVATKSIMYYGIPSHNEFCKPYRRYVKKMRDIEDKTN